MDLQKENWNDYYANSLGQNSDQWLSQYSEFFEAGGKVLDLGCGNGSNIPFLLNRNAEIYAVDYSEIAIKHIKNQWDITVLLHDIRNPLPFDADSFDLILADLSLHYFPFLETTRIISDLYRVTKARGILIARVNSINDTNHGSGIGTEVERNYYDLNGRRKRFFDREMVYDLFDNGFSISKAIENRTNKYNDEKILWEIVAGKIA
jgi:SAM-dependent methyltransferase